MAFLSATPYKHGRIIFSGKVRPILRGTADHHREDPWGRKTLRALRYHEVMTGHAAMHVMPRRSHSGLAQPPKPAKKAPFRSLRLAV